MKDSDIGSVHPPFRELANAGVDEDEWILKYNGRTMTFVTLGNGGTYQLLKHPVREYTQIATVAYFRDDRAILDAHYAVVNFLTLADNRMVRDVLWNWGFPMVSAVPLRPSDIDLDSIAKAGVLAHIVGNTFFGYNDFERSPLNKAQWNVPTSDEPQASSSENYRSASYDLPDDCLPVV